MPSIALSRLVTTPAASLVALLALSACGDQDVAGPMGGNGTGSGGASSSAEYFPMQVGNRWTYQVTEPGLPAYRKEQVIVNMEPVGGTGPHKDRSVFRVETRKFAAANPSLLEDATISWQIREGSKIVRYRETSCTRSSARLMNDIITGCEVNVEDYWNPARVRVDEMPMGMAPARNQTWPEEYVEYKNSFNRGVTPPVVTMTMATNKDTWLVLDTGATVRVPAGTFDGCLVLRKTSSTLIVKTYTFCRGVGKVKEEGLGQTEELATLPTIR